MNTNLKDLLETINPEYIIKSLAMFLTSGWGIGAMLLLIALFGYVNWRNFKKRIGPCVGDMEKANKLFDWLNAQDPESSKEEVFAEFYDEFGEKINEIPILHHVWSEFTETLIPNNGDGKVLNTHSVTSYFTRDNLIGNQVDLRYYSAFPNILTGLGILGTFIGLVAGISLASGALLSNDPAQTRDALSKLLDGASLAFWTSIFGLFSSILFSVREKNHVHHFDKLRKIWISRLDERLQRVTIESINRKVLEQSEQQTKALQEFGEPLALELASKMGQTLTHTVTAPMSEALSDIQSSIEELIQAQTNSSAAMLEQVTEKMTQSITGTASKEVEEFSSGIRYMTSSLEQTMEHVTKQLSDASSAFSTSVNGLAESSENIQQTIKGSAALTEQQQSLMADSMEINEKLATVTQSIENAVDVIRESVEKGHETSEEVSRSATSIQGTMDELKAANLSVQNSWSEYEKRFEGVDVSLGNAFSEIDEGLQRYSQMTKNYLMDLDEHTSSITRHIAGASAEIHNAVEELSDTLSK